jgi:hypothetical protein
MHLSNFLMVILTLLISITLTSSTPLPLSSKRSLIPFFDVEFCWSTHSKCLKLPQPNAKCQVANGIWDDLKVLRMYKWQFW